MRNKDVRGYSSKDLSAIFGVVHQENWQRDGTSAEDGFIVSAEGELQERESGTRLLSSPVAPASTPASSSTQQELMAVKPEKKAKKSKKGKKDGERRSKRSRRSKETQEDPGTVASGSKKRAKRVRCAGNGT